MACNSEKTVGWKFQYSSIRFSLGSGTACVRALASDPAPVLLQLYSKESMMEQMAEYEDTFADYGYDMKDIERMAKGETPLGTQNAAADAGSDKGDEL